MGLVHAAASAYWGLGGTALVATLGAQMTSLFAGREWLLLPVAAVKAALALAPLGLPTPGPRPAPRAGRMIAWAVAVVLTTWGGIGMATAQLVLWGVIRPDGGYDRMGMIGHAWLWDPLFLAWGVFLSLGMRRATAATPTPVDN